MADGGTFLGLLAKKGTFLNDLSRGDLGASDRRKEQKAKEAYKMEKDALDKQILLRKREEENTAFNTAWRARRRSMASSNRTNYNRGTLLTSPSGGTIGGSSGGGKTLLGS